MTGTTGDLIPIIITPVIALASWLAVIFHVSSHPWWDRHAPAETVTTHALEDSLPAQLMSRPWPAVPGQRPSTALGEVTPERARPNPEQLVGSLKGERL